MADQLDTTMTLQQYNLADLVAPEMRSRIVNSTIICSEQALDKIKISLPGNSEIRRDYQILLSEPEFKGKLLLALGPGTGAVDIKTAGPALLDVRIWRGGTLRMGSGTTVNQARIICDNADVIVGNDGLWSDEILIQSNDQHGIIDVATGSVINADRRRIIIGDHVWLGRRSIVMPDVIMGDGSILAAGAILTRDVPPRTIYGGVPAREIRNGVTWSRSPAGLDPSERVYLADTRSPA